MTPRQNYTIEWDCRQIGKIEMHLDIDFLMKNLTLEEKAGLCSGEGFWWTKSIMRLGLPSVMVSDGPHGLRKQETNGSDHLGLNKSVVAVCFPTGSAMAASFNRDLLYELGNHLGEAAKAERLHTVLGPAINIKRSPLCGRNFEYLSEDPYLAGELASSYINGVQENGVGVCVKHFAANNQEYHRMSTDVVVSERALREVYFAAFEKAVKQSKPWSVMCAYNRINGIYCCENDWLLNKVLRKDWGFDGIVMTDWGAMNDRVKSLQAGLELEMPSSNGLRDKLLVEAVKNGELTSEELDKHVKRLLEWLDKGLCNQSRNEKRYDKQKQHEFAKKAAEDCAVLLKNRNEVLPIPKGTKVAFIGTFAAISRYQGGGSSHVESYKVTNALECSRKMAQISYAPGWKDDGETEDISLLNQAVAIAENAEVAVVFAGLPDSFESEGFDRKHMDLPFCQNHLIAEVLKVQPNTVVVLHNGSPITMPWIGEVPSVLELYLAGEASGEACADLLFGINSPSGHLAETFPLRLEDSSCYTSFPGDGKSVTYTEDVFVGYRWYDTRKMAVLFPFGHGLTYTKFQLSNPHLTVDCFDGFGSVDVYIDVTNVGQRFGKQVVQLYMAPCKGKVQRPIHELKGFEKVALYPQETVTVKFVLDARSFSYFEPRINDWRFENGRHTLQIGFSCADLPISLSLDLKGKPLPLVADEVLTVGDLIEAGKADVLGEYGELLMQRFGINEQEGNSVLSREAAANMCNELPVHCLASFLEVPTDFQNSVYSLLNKEVLIPS